LSGTFKAGEPRLSVFWCIQRHGEAGITSLEIQHLLDLPWYTVNAQIRHLKREGKIRAKGKRKIVTGGHVNVWVQTEEGRKIVIQ
jgi:predicted transcriptional regulator